MDRSVLVIALLGGACGGGGSSAVDGAAPDTPAAILTITQADAHVTQMPFAFIAAQDGDTGAWQVLHGTSGVYTASIASGRYTVVAACSPGTIYDSPNVTVVAATMAELPTLYAYCNDNQSAALAVISSGLGAETAALYTDFGAGIATTGQPLVTFSSVPVGMQDVIGLQPAQNAPIDRIAIARAIAVTAPTTNSSMSFATLGFAPDMFVLSQTGALGPNETVGGHVELVTENGAAATLMSAVAPVSAPFPAVPMAHLQPNDIHTAVVGAADSVTHAQRDVSFAFHAGQNVTVALPPAITGQVDVSSTSPYVRSRVTWTPYPNAVLYRAALVQNDRDTRIVLTPGWLGTATSWVMPDLTAVPGWDNSWMIAVGAVTSWTVTATTSTGALARLLQQRGPLAADSGVTTTSAIAAGVLTP